MLTAEQYEAIGRLTLAFNEIEYCFEIYTAHLLGAPEWGVSLLLAGEGKFYSKADRFDHILQAIGGEYLSLVVQIDQLRAWVKKAKELAKQRNDFVHALVVHDFSTNETRLRIKGADVICNADEITFLAVEAVVMGDQLHTHSGDLLVSLIEAREAK